LPKKESFKSSEKAGKIFLIEDYVDISSVSEARKLADTIYFENKEFISQYKHSKYSISWAWYSDIFQFCITYLEIQNLIQIIEDNNFTSIEIGAISPQYIQIFRVYFFRRNIVLLGSQSNQLINTFKQVIFNGFALIYSLISLVFFILRPGKNVGTYTGDFIYKNTQSDFRLSNLYAQYKKNKIHYVEFIRITKSKNFLDNIFKRKRFAIYHTSIIFFVALFTKKEKYTKYPVNFYQSVIYSFHYDNLVLKKSILIIEKLFIILRINNFISISFSSRSAHLSIAAKSLGIKTIGIMHGLQQKDYAVYEFMESYSERQKIGCDVYGVWSPHYLDYFKKYSKLMSPENIFYSGLLRPIKNFNKTKPFKRISSNSLRVLIISEPLINVREVIPYVKALLKNDAIELAIKVRPMINDTYYEELKVHLPEISNLKVHSGTIEEIGRDYDVFIGSNSTAVIEGSLFGKISILLNTKKFGDYFEMDSLIPGHSLLVNDPEFLCQNIVDRVNNEVYLQTVDKIRARFFGDNKDGSQWLIDQL